MSTVGVIRIRDSYYSKNGLRSFSIRLKKEDNTYLSLMGKRIDLVLFNSQSRETYKWSSEDVRPENLLLLEKDGADGRITFPEIKSWKMPVGLHVGDLIAYDNDGFTTVYQTIEFNITQNFDKPY